MGFFKEVGAGWWEGGSMPFGKEPKPNPERKAPGAQGVGVGGLRRVSSAEMPGRDPQRF